MKKLFAIFSLLFLINLANAVVEFRCADPRYKRHVIMPNVCTVGDITLTNQDSDLRFIGPAQQKSRIDSLYFHSSKFEILTAQLFQIFPILHHLSVFRCDVNGRIDDNLLKYLTPIINLELRVNEITEISENAFKALRETNKISLSSNKLTTLPENVFQYNKKLTNVDLDGNQITNLSPNTFKFNQQMKAINLRRNALKNIPENLFASLRSLEDIYVSDNQLETLPANVFRNNPRLVCIDLDNNKISKLSPNIFRSLNRLDKLYLLNNDCISRQYGLGTNIGRSNQELTSCYENWR